MGIKEKATYGDYYWASQVEAEKFYQDEVEKALGGPINRIYDELGIDEALPDSMKGFFAEMKAPKSFAWGGILARFGSEVADSVLSQTLNHAMKDFNYWMAEKFSDTRMTAAEACIAYQRISIDKELWGSRMLSEGYGLSEAIHVYGTTLPYPSIPDIMLYSRYAGGGQIDRGKVRDYFDVPPDEFELWHWLTLQRLSTGDAQTLYRRGHYSVNEFYTELAKIGWNSKDRIGIEVLAWSMPNAMLLVQGDLFQRQSDDKIIKDISLADINPAYANTYLDAILTKPASQDVIAYALRKDPTLGGIGEELRRIGIHPAYHDLYKELAYPIPPVADIITMAVREAFSPGIAAKFGQYDDYPKAFQEWALKKGLTADWAKRYWAAHWSLPSPQQGFEMLHRGVIDQSELHLLLRALDVMPFWRDKLTQIAYRRLTRVDIRRMYGVGVLDEAGVYAAYLEQGYNDRDAKRMTDFTVRQILASQSKFTASDIVSAYSKYMINQGEASSLMGAVGVRSENISFILSSADYKRSWELTNSRISAIRNMYKKRVYSPDDARGKLSGLNLPSERIDALMEQWYIEDEPPPVRHWTTAQTLAFIKDGSITAERGRRELVNLGYDTEHIEVYMKETA